MANVPEKTMMNWTSLQNTITGTKKRAMRALMAEYTSLLKEPAEGFVVKVDDPFNWDVGIYGPPSTPYWGGYFKVHVSFPDEYPFEPPKLKFKSRFWHPNVYHNGSVCMSILHDPQAEDIPTDLPREEKWNPTLSVRTVLLSLISIMGSPNPDSPANPEASKMYRSWLDDGDEDYVKVIEDIVKRSKKTASRDGVSVPKTLEEYLTKPKPKVSEPLVNYSSDDDSSDHSELLSLPSSQESDHEDFFDTEPSWATGNHNVTNAEQNNPRTFSQEGSVPSLSNHHRNSLGRGTSNQNLEGYFSLRSQTLSDTNISPPFEPNETESNILSRIGVNIDPISSSIVGISEPVAKVDSAILEFNGRSSKDNDRILSTTSTDANQNLLSEIEQAALTIEVDQTYLLRAELEQTSLTCIGQASSWECSNDTTHSSELDHTTLEVNHSNTISNTDQASSSCANDDSSSQASRTAMVCRPPNGNRKRRRPPRLFLYSQINDSKKRKRQ